MSRLLITINGIDEMDSSIFASSMLIFGADFFSYQTASGTKILECVSSAQIAKWFKFKSESSITPMA